MRLRSGNRSIGRRGAEVRRKRATAAACSSIAIGMATLTTESNNQSMTRVDALISLSEQSMARHVRRNGRIHERRRSRSVPHKRTFADRDLRAAFPMQRPASAPATSFPLYLLRRISSKKVTDCYESGVMLDDEDWDSRRCVIFDVNVAIFYSKSSSRMTKRHLLFEIVISRYQRRHFLFEIIIDG